MAKINLPDWHHNFYQRSPIFEHLSLILSPIMTTQWPSIAQLNRLLCKRLSSSYGKPIQFSRPDPQLSMSYEERIYYKGEVETRKNNWHDFFNSCIWALFPKTKVILNQLHIEQIKIQSGTQRTAYRDTITHLDESGVIVVCCDHKMIEDLQQHHWQQVFYQQQEQWGKNIDAFVFGHGIYEKALNPFIGFTAKMLPLIVKTEFFSLSVVQRYQQMDILLAEQIAKQQLLQNNKSLSPFPILGVPGWFEQNKEASFYQNTQYFRPK